MGYLVYDDIEGEIRAERSRQDAKWGEQNHDPFLYLTILVEEVGEVGKAALEARFGAGSGGVPHWDDVGLEHYRKELIQVAAVTKAMIECLDRNKWRRS